MKRLLALGLILSANAMAQGASADPGCRILIGDEWIALGATSMDSCLKYAESAATPGERQVAEFNSQLLSYQDGSHFSSRDGGKTWQRFSPHEAAGQISSLNVLRAGPSPSNSAGPARGALPAPAAPPRPPTPAIPGAAAWGSAKAEPERAAASPPAAEPRQTATVLGEAGAMGCQMLIDGQWHETPTASLESCGEALIGNLGRNARSGQAYWGGNYLFYSQNQLYRSPDGKAWKPVALQ